MQQSVPLFLLYSNVSLISTMYLISLNKNLIAPLIGALSSSPIIQLNFASFLQLRSYSPFSEIFIFVYFTVTPSHALKIFILLSWCLHQNISHRKYSMNAWWIWMDVIIISPKIHKILYIFENKNIDIDIWQSR